MDDSKNPDVLEKMKWWKDLEDSANERREYVKHSADYRRRLISVCVSQLDCPVFSFLSRKYEKLETWSQVSKACGAILIAYDDDCSPGRESRAILDQKHRMRKEKATRIRYQFTSILCQMKRAQEDAHAAQERNMKLLHFFGLHQELGDCLASGSQKASNLKVLTNVRQPTDQCGKENNAVPHLISSDDHAEHVLAQNPEVLSLDNAASNILCHQQKWNALVCESCPQRPASASDCPRCPQFSDLDASAEFPSIASTREPSAQAKAAADTDEGRSTLECNSQQLAGRHSARPSSDLSCTSAECNEIQEAANVGLRQPKSLQVCETPTGCKIEGPADEKTAKGGAMGLGSTLSSHCDIDTESQMLTNNEVLLGVQRVFPCEDVVQKVLDHAFGSILDEQKGLELPWIQVGDCIKVDHEDGVGSGWEPSRKQQDNVALGDNLKDLRQEPSGKHNALGDTAVQAGGADVPSIISEERNPCLKIEKSTFLPELRGEQHASWQEVINLRSINNFNEFSRSMQVPSSNSQDCTAKDTVNSEVTGQFEQNDEGGRKPISAWSEKEKLVVLSTLNNTMFLWDDQPVQFGSWPEMEELLCTAYAAKDGQLKLFAYLEEKEGISRPMACCGAIFELVKAYPPEQLLPFRFIEDFFAAKSWNEQLRDGLTFDHLEVYQEKGHAQFWQMFVHHAVCVKDHSLATLTQVASVLIDALFLSERMKEFPSDKATVMHQNLVEFLVGGFKGCSLGFRVQGIHGSARENDETMRETEDDPIPLSYNFTSVPDGEESYHECDTRMLQAPTRTRSQNSVRNLVVLDGVGLRLKQDDVLDISAIFETGPSLKRNASRRSLFSSIRSLVRTPFRLWSSKGFSKGVESMEDGFVRLLSPRRSGLRDTRC